MAGRKNSKNNQLLSELRDDYIRAQQRREKLKWEQRYFLTNFNVDELYEVETFIAMIDAIVELLPEGQRILAKETILKDEAVKVVAGEVGYDYTWALELRRKASTNIISALSGRNLITGTLGTHILEEVRYVLTQSHTVRTDTDSNS